MSINEDFGAYQENNANAGEAESIDIDLATKRGIEERGESSFSDDAEYSGYGMGFYDGAKWVLSLTSIQIELLRKEENADSMDK